MSGWFEGRAPDEEDLEAAGDLTMGELLYGYFGSATITSGVAQEASQDAQETIYGVQGLMDGNEPSWAALKALSGSGVSGAIHLRTAEDDVVFTLTGDGTVDHTEETFLSA